MFYIRHQLTRSFYILTKFIDTKRRPALNCVTQNVGCQIPIVFGLA